MVISANCLYDGHTMDGQCTEISKIEEPATLIEYQKTTLLTIVIIQITHKRHRLNG